jgi:hypothetical protein
VGKTQEEMLEEGRQEFYQKTPSEYKHKFSRSSFSGRGVLGPPRDTAVKPVDKTITKTPWEEKLQTLRA